MTDDEIFQVDLRTESRHDELCDGNCRSLACLLCHREIRTCAAIDGGRRCWWCDIGLLDVQQPEAVRCGRCGQPAAASVGRRNLVCREHALAYMSREGS